MNNPNEVRCERKKLASNLYDLAEEKAQDYGCNSEHLDEWKAANLLESDAKRIAELEGCVSRKDDEIAGLRIALQAIIDNRPQIVMNGFAKVGDDNAVGWNVHNIARMALAQPSNHCAEAPMAGKEKV